MTSLFARCRCGQVEIEIIGPPIVVATCHCDDCQEAGRRIEALPGADSVMDAFAGTPMVLVRGDRVRYRRGRNNLDALRLRAETPTRRQIASCCNTAMLVDFDKGPFWNSIFASALGPTTPSSTCRLQTRYQPAEIPVPTGVPSYKSFPVGLALQMLSAWIGMTLRPETRP